MRRKTLIIPVTTSVTAARPFLVLTDIQPIFLRLLTVKPVKLILLPVIQQANLAASAHLLAPPDILKTLQVSKIAAHPAPMDGYSHLQTAVVNVPKKLAPVTRITLLWLHAAAAAIKAGITPLATTAMNYAELAPLKHAVTMDIHQHKVRCIRNLMFILVIP